MQGPRRQEILCFAVIYPKNVEWYLAHTAGPQITLFCSKLSHNVEEMPIGTRLYQLACGKTGFVTHHFT